MRHHTSPLSKNEISKPTGFQDWAIIIPIRFIFNIFLFVVGLIPRRSQEGSLKGRGVGKVTDVMRKSMSGIRPVIAPNIGRIFLRRVTPAPLCRFCPYYTVVSKGRVKKVA
jgi:hypothetical protein